MRVNPFAAADRLNYLEPNLVVMANGTGAEFFTIQYGEQLSFDFDSGQYILIDTYQLGNSFNLYEQYINYVVDVSTRRNLNLADLHQTKCVSEETPPPRVLESSKEELMSTEYFIFYFMAQLGGLYSFLVLIFGIVVGHIASRSFEQDVINSVYYYSFKTKQSMNSMKHSRRVLPGNPNNFYPGEIQNRSINNENDPLILEQISVAGGNPQNISKKVSLRNQGQNEMFDGGEQIHQNNGAPPYTTGDLIFSIFC